MLTIIGFAFAFFTLKPLLKNNYKKQQMSSHLTKEQEDFIATGGRMLK